MPRREQQARMHDAVPAAPVTNEWIGFFGNVDLALRERLGAAAIDASFIHLDYHPDNVLADSNGVSAIIDGTNARFGDRRADLARSWASLRFVFRPAAAIFCCASPMTSSRRRGGAATRALPGRRRKCRCFVRGQPKDYYG